MACRDGCDPTTALLTIITETAQFQLTSDDAEGDTANFNATEDGISRKFWLNGDMAKAGSGVKRMTFTWRTSCSAGLPLWTAWKSSANKFCGSGSVVSDCCTDEFFQTLDVVNIKRPNIGTDVDLFEIELLAVFA